MNGPVVPRDLETGDGSLRVARAYRREVHREVIKHIRIAAEETDRP